MVGNLKIFFGPGAFDHYAHWLRTIGEPVLPYEWYLWYPASVLVVAVVAHVAAATSSAAATQGAPGQVRAPAKVQGELRGAHDALGRRHPALFVVYHILDLTTGTVNPVGDRRAAVRERGRRLRHLVRNVFYIVAILALGFHLRHGFWSAAQTLGSAAATRDRALKAVAVVLALRAHGRLPRRARRRPDRIGELT